jgi:hypothetical protein
VQYLAAQFSLASPHTITGVQGWMRVEVGGDLAFVIYGDDGDDVPDQTAELFSTTLTLSGGLTDPPNWEGPDSGLDWTLTTGTYWLAFEVRNSSFFFGQMPFPSTFPLGNEATLTEGSTPNYFADDNNDIGIRIFGEPVPEPSTLVLLAGGLAG